MDPAEAKMLQLSDLQEINDVIALGDSDIQRFYCNVAVFITGGTGFLGKLLIEKLFRSCKIRKMNLLMRPKNGNDVKQRLGEVFKNPVFDILHKDQPSFAERIVIVEGDVALPRLGISDEDWSTLTEEVTVIFHVAAKVKFDEPLRQATLTNVRGTREMLKLGHACKLLRSFVYVSTAYSHTTESRVRGAVLEQFYPISVTPGAVIELAEMFDADKMNDLAPSLMSGWPNTYSFTKALAEETVRTLGAGLPICIVRPAIVISAYKEPLPGWIDEEYLYGANGLGLGLLMGVIRVVASKPNVNVDLVPADFVNNAVIAAGKETGKRWDDGQKEIKIYTVANNRRNLNWEECIKILHSEVRKLPSPKAIWYCYTLQAGDNVTYTTLRFLLHDLPAFTIDGICVLLGKRPRFNLIYKKVHKITSLLKHFTTNRWSFGDENLLNMYKNMSEKDRVIYNFDISTISNRDMIVIWGLGLRKYIIKDELKGTMYALKKQKIFKMLSLVVLFFYIFVFCMLIQYIFVVLNY